MKRTTVGVVVAAVVMSLAACAPGDWRWHNVGPANPVSPQLTQGAAVTAKPVADDGLSPGFQLGVICTGLVGWRWGNYINLNTYASNWSGDGDGARWKSEVWCPAGHYVTGRTIWRH
jgi:hypothetical protein